MIKSELFKNIKIYPMVFSIGLVVILKEFIKV